MCTVGFFFFDFSNNADYICFILPFKEGYFGYFQQTPDFIGAMKRCMLEMKKKKSCQSLVCLGQLPRLRVLQIRRMNSIRCLGEEFYYQKEEESKDFANVTTTIFPSLTKFHLEESKNLEEWVAPLRHDTSAFPCLEELNIRGCGNLISIPDLRLSVQYPSVN